MLNYITMHFNKNLNLKLVIKIVIYKLFIYCQHRICSYFYECKKTVKWMCTRGN